jgi:hypothetical protein
VTTLAMFPDLKAPDPPAGIDLRCCDVAEVLAEVTGAALVMADPPWQYSESPGVANPETSEIYNGLPDSQISAHLDSSWHCVENGRLLCWYTWPKEEQWRAAGLAGRWGTKVTGGAWVKTNLTPGVGYHWRGRSEPVAVFTKGTTGRARAVLRNEHRSEATSHSEKPVDWLRAMVRAWTDPGDLVLDLYAGLAPVARACKAEGRRYIGAEIDPDRHERALGLLALYRPETL